MNLLLIARQIPKTWPLHPKFSGSWDLTLQTLSSEESIQSLVRSSSPLTGNDWRWSRRNFHLFGLILWKRRIIPRAYLLGFNLQHERIISWRPKGLWMIGPETIARLKRKDKELVYVSWMINQRIINRRQEIRMLWRIGAKDSWR